MAKIKAERLIKKLHSIGGCDARPDTWADGWDKAIDAAIELVEKERSRVRDKKKRKCNDLEHIFIRKADNDLPETFFVIENDKYTLWTAFDGKQTAFDIVERNGDELTLISRDILCFEPFDINCGNKYDESSVKAFLNEGFIHRFRKEFVSLLTSEGFYLPSEEEIRKYYPDEEDRAKKYKGETYPYWLRTPSASNSSTVRAVNTHGGLSCSNAFNAYGIAPACKIRIK